MSAIGNKPHAENNELTIWLEKRGVKDSGKVALIIEGALKLIAASALVVAAYFTIKCAIIPFYASALTMKAKFFITLMVALPAAVIGITWVAGIGSCYGSGVQDLVAVINYKEPLVPKHKLTDENL